MGLERKLHFRPQTLSRRETIPGWLHVLHVSVLPLLFWSQAASWAVLPLTYFSRSLYPSLSLLQLVLLLAYREAAAVLLLRLPLQRVRARVLVAANHLQARQVRTAFLGNFGLLVAMVDARRGQPRGAVLRAARELCLWVVLAGVAEEWVWALAAWELGVYVLE
jgi:hypothetical protein